MRVVIVIIFYSHVGVLLVVVFFLIASRLLNAQDMSFCKLCFIFCVIVIIVSSLFGVSLVVFVSFNCVFFFHIFLQNTLLSQFSHLLALVRRESTTC